MPITLFKRRALAGDTSGRWVVCLFTVLLTLFVVVGAGLVAWWQTPTGRTALMPLALFVAGPPEVTMAEAVPGEEAKSVEVPDTSCYAALLKAYVDENGFVDYQALAKDADTTAGLDAYIASLADTPLDKLTRDQHLATLINAYNAFTLRLILDHRPLDSIYDIPESKRWKAKRWVVGGKTVSLDSLEHEWIRPNFREPRVHWALVCAAYSCPRLLNEPYVAETLENQFEAQAAYVHQDKRFFYFKGDVLYLTELYSWFAGDFEQVDGSALKHAARYSPRLAKLLDEGRPPKVRAIPYDWSLNAKRLHATK